MVFGSKVNCFRSQRGHTGELSLDPLRWGPDSRIFVRIRKVERSRSTQSARRWPRCPTFRDAYQGAAASSRLDGFFEWKAIKGRAKQPYAIAMKDGYPFAVGGIWENWKEPTSGEWIRTFAIHYHGRQ